MKSLNAGARNFTEFFVSTCGVHPTRFLIAAWMRTGLCWNALGDNYINPIDRGIVTVLFHLMYSSRMPDSLPIHFTLSNIFLLIFLFPIFFVPVEPVEEDLGNIGLCSRVSMVRTTNWRSPTLLMFRRGLEVVSLMSFSLWIWFFRLFPGDGCGSTRQEILSFLQRLCLPGLFLDDGGLAV